MEPPQITSYIIALTKDAEGELVIGCSRYNICYLRLNYPANEEKIEEMRRGCIFRAQTEARCKRPVKKITASSWEGFREIGYNIE